MSWLRSILPAILVPMSALAQQPVFPDMEGYAAWKRSLIPPGQTVHGELDTHGTTPAGELRGGSATCDCWVAPDASYHTINNNAEWNVGGYNNTDDGSYGPITLPFSFFLYGQYWTEAYININGNVSFGNEYGTFTASGFPVAGFTMVAPFWADVDLGGNVPGGGNRVSYKVTPTALYVNWDRVGYYSEHTDKLNTFQLIITDGTDPVVPNGANVSFCYKDLQWTTGDASSGMGGFGGSPANVGANQGNGIDYLQFGRFDHEGADYDGPFGDVDGVSWLDDKYFTFKTAQTTGNVPPVVSGQSVCDSLTLCTGQPELLNVLFLSPEPDQVTTPTSYAPTLSNYTTVSATPGLTASITTQFLPTLADVGYHEVFFEGTDNGDPVMTSVLKIVVHVVASPQIDPGSLVVCDTDAPVDLMTVLGGAPPSGGTWTDPIGQDHGGTFHPGEDPDGAYAYSVDVGGICSATGTATLSTVAHVNAGQDISLAYCSSDLPVDLFSLIPGGPQPGGIWQGPGGTAATGLLDPATAASGTYTYHLEGTTPCLNDTAFLSIAIPQAVDAGHDTSIAFCRDASPFSLRDQLAGTPDATGTWTDLSGAVVPDLFDPATGLFGVYTYTVPAVLPCPTLSAMLTIAIDPLPVAGSDAGLVICANGGDTPLFPLLGGGPDADGHWLDPLGSPHSGVLDPSLELSGPYRYISIGPGTCAHLSDTAVVDVHIDPVPVITFTAEPDSGCHPLLVTFTNTTDPIYVGNACIWDPGDGTGTVQACGGFEHLYEQPGWYHVKLRITTPEGCTDQLIAPGAVLVDPAPTADFIWTPEVGTAGNSTIVFTATDPHAVDFLWSFPRQDIDTARQVSRAFEDAISGVYQVCLGVADRYGCTDTLCHDIPVEVSDLYMPTGFTPNGDGRNDVLLPVLSNIVLEDYEFQVFDRWGRPIFETRDTAQGWNGRLGNDGPVLPDGTYVWRLSARPVHAADKEEHFGSVTLFK